MLDTIFTQIEGENCSIIHDLKSGAWHYTQLNAFCIGIFLKFQDCEGGFIYSGKYSTS